MITFDGEDDCDLILHSPQMILVGPGLTDQKGFGAVQGGFGKKVSEVQESERVN